MNRFALVACLVVATLASSHSEAPGTSGQPNADISDFYMFRSYEDGREDYVTFLMNTHPLQAPNGGPNYHALSQDHFYEIYVDNNGDGQEDKVFQFLPGARLGGEIESTKVFGNSKTCECFNNQINCEDPDRRLDIHSGLKLNIANVDVPVALKFIGPLSAEDTSALNYYEHYYLEVIEGTRDMEGMRATNDNGGDDRFSVPFQYAGTKTFTSDAEYERYSRTHIHEIVIPGCTATGRVFVGQRKESFNIQLGRIFDLINLIPIPGFPGGVVECEASSDIAGKNVNTFSLEVPISCLTQGGETVIGAWSAVRKVVHTMQPSAGPDGIVQVESHTPGEQVSRLGHPLVNELLIGLRDKDRFSSSVPTGDIQFIKYVTHPTLPAIVNILFGDEVRRLTGLEGDLSPAVPRTDLVTAFLTGIPGINQPAGVQAAEILRLNTAIAVTKREEQHRYGVVAGDAAGFPNGRRPGDDVVDIAMQVMMGKLRTLGLPEHLTGGTNAPVGSVPFSDGAWQSSRQFQREFPYLVTPNAGGRTNEAPDTCPTDCSAVSMCPEPYVETSIDSVTSTATITYGGYSGNGFVAIYDISNDSAQQNVSSSSQDRTTGHVKTFVFTDADPSQTYTVVYPFRPQRTYVARVWNGLMTSRAAWTETSTFGTVPETVQRASCVLHRSVILSTRWDEENKKCWVVGDMCDSLERGLHGNFVVRKQRGGKWYTIRVVTAEHLGAHDLGTVADLWKDQNAENFFISYYSRDQDYELLLDDPSADTALFHSGMLSRDELGRPPISCHVCGDSIADNGECLGRSSSAFLCPSDCAM